MKHIKKILCLVLTALLLTGAFTACGKAETDDGRLSVVCTIFPEYDWLNEILGDRVNDVSITLLLDKGVDLHNYQPTTDDIVNISDCDVFVYVGGESDSWVDDALANAANDDMRVVCLMDALGENVKEEEVVEGMEDEEHDHDEDELEYDEHVWLSLKNAEVLTDAITSALEGADPDNAAEYRENQKAYAAKLQALDDEYQSAVDSADQKVLLFGDRFPFRYLTDDYGITYYAAFVGCSAETEASFETVAFLAAKVDELELKTVMTIDGSDSKLAETIVSTTRDKNQTILSMNSMQSISSEDIDNGADYLEIMESNLTVLKQALEA